MGLFKRKELDYDIEERTEMLKSNSTGTYDAEKTECIRTGDLIHTEHNKTEIISNKNLPKETYNQEIERTVYVNRELMKQEMFAPVVHLVDRNNNGRAFEKVINGCIVIGRKKELCDIVIDYDNTVSSRQCRLYTEDNEVYVVDLGGTNKTYLNDIPVTGDTVIHSGDVLGFGRIDLHVTIRD